MRYFWGYTKQDFRGVFSKPNVILGIDVFLVAALRCKETTLIYQQVFDQANAEIFGYPDLSVFPTHEQARRHLGVKPDFVVAFRVVSMYH